MVDQIYYKIQYPLKKSVDLMKKLDQSNLESFKGCLNEKDKEKIEEFVTDWHNGGKKKLISLIENFKKKQ